MVQDFCDEPYGDMPYGYFTLNSLLLERSDITLYSWSEATLLFTLGRTATRDEGDPGGVGVYVNRGESPGGASPWP
jgi:hypothetical protein